VITVRPNDPAVVSLLDAFRDEAEERANAAVDRSEARESLNVARATGLFGLLSAAGGTIVAVPSCAGVTLTFWAGGGTGWPCAGGVAAAVGGVGAFLVSAFQGFQAAGDVHDAKQDFNQADGEARDIFEALKSYASP